MPKGVCNSVKKHKKLLTFFVILFVVGALLFSASFFISGTETKATFVFSRDEISTLDLSLDRCEIHLHRAEGNDLSVHITSDGELVSCRAKSGELTVSDSLSASDIFSKNILKYGFLGIGGIIRGYTNEKAPVIDIYLPSDFELSSLSARLDGCVLSSESLSCSLFLAKIKNTEIKIQNADIIKSDNVSRRSIP